MLRIAVKVRVGRPELRGLGFGLVLGCGGVTVKGLGLNPYLETLTLI